MLLSLPLLEQPIRLRKQNAAQQVYDPVRKKWVAYTPEEAVRQRLLHYLLHTMQYPQALIAIEKQVPGSRHRADIVVYNRAHTPWLIAECKAPEVPVSESTLHQLLRYHAALPCTYWLLCNGLQTLCANACAPDNILWMDALPAYGV